MGGCRFLEFRDNRPKCFLTRILVTAETYPCVNADILFYLMLKSNSRKKIWFFPMRNFSVSCTNQGRFPFSQKFRKFRFGAKWKTFFRFAWLENSQKKWNCLEGSPGSSTFPGNFTVGRTEKTFPI